MSDAEIEELLADPNFEVDGNMGFQFDDVDDWVQDAQKALRGLLERAKQAEAELTISVRISDVSGAMRKLEAEHCYGFPEFWDFLDRQQAQP